MANESLRQQLALLYQLQEHDLELLSIREKIRAIPVQIAQLAEGVKRYEEEIAVKSAELEEKEKGQRAKNAELEMNAVQREKYRTEQRTVTSNEAYTALERQIEFLDSKDEETEDAILALMEESDQVKEALAKLEAAVSREIKKTDVRTQELEEKLHALKTERDEKLKHRKTFLPKVDEKLKSEYHRWMKARLSNRSKTAQTKIGFVALVKRGTCGSCRIALQPQTLKEAEKYQEPVYCSNCKRLLYVEPVTPGIPFP